MNSIPPLTASRRVRESYASIEQILQADKHPSQPIRLHSNETPFDLPHELKQQLAIKMANMPWNRYPDFYNTELTALIAKQAGVQPENVVLGNGSSQLIQQMVGCFSKFISGAVIECPTFTFYHQVFQNERIPYQEWRWTEGGLDNLTDFPTITEPTLVILTSPNNPTGAVFPVSQLQILLKKYPECIFVVDEAYGEFGGESAVELVNTYSNLLVLKTLSKGYGLPSIRFGYVVGSAAVIGVLKKHTVPFTINIFTELVVGELLTNPVFVNALKSHQERIKNLRDFVFHLLSEMTCDDSFTVQPSAANFLLLRFRNAELLEQVKQALSERTVLVSYPLPQSLRLTIGTEAQMNQVLRILRRALAQHRSCANTIEEVLL
jgi:histidinol-phosphate aminotransferase